MFSSSEQKFLLTLARRAIEHFFQDATRLIVGEAAVPLALREQRACFVTLTSNFELRGCIGSLEPHQPLYLDAIDNAVAAAFRDDRFLPLTPEEYSTIDVEISVLSLPQPLMFSSAEDLLQKLTVGVDGVIIQRGEKNATYLPQVWDEILDKKDFLSSLCLKADLPPDDWQKPGLALSTYRVEIMHG